MANVVINGSTVGTRLQSVLVCDEIQPGSAPSYTICKILFEDHVFGARLTQAPIELAQSQKRDITIAAAGPLEEKLKKQFQSEWRGIDADGLIRNVKTLSRVYGIASIAVLCDTIKPTDPIPYEKLHELNIAFNVLDPLNTAGSLVLNQDPNSMDFQKVDAIAIAGTQYHRSRAVVVMNEKPVYISYTSSAYGFVGRSVYQRILFPLKSFVLSQVTDDMVVKKAGLLIAMIKTVSSAVDRLQQAFGAIKRSLLKIAEVDNVLQIGADDKIETLNMQNLDGAFGMARKDILDNMATGANMPPILLNNEAFSNGFSNGDEDAKALAQYIDGLREEMQPLYSWFDIIVMHKAWSPRFYKTIQAEFPATYGKVTYEQAFYDWKNSFAATWPNLLVEPDSEKARAAEVKLKAAVAVFQVAEPICDPENKATLMGWLADTVNSNKTMFPVPLDLDLDALASYVPPVQEKEPDAGHPFANQDSVAEWLRAASVIAERRRLIAPVKTEPRQAGKA